MNDIVSLIEQSARVLEAVGICVILLGTLAATAVFLWRLVKRAEGRWPWTRSSPSE